MRIASSPHGVISRVNPKLAECGTTSDSALPVQSCSDISRMSVGATSLLLLYETNGVVVVSLNPPRTPLNSALFFVTALKTEAARSSTNTVVAARPRSIVSPDVQSTCQYHGSAR